MYNINSTLPILRYHIPVFTLRRYFLFFPNCDGTLGYPFPRPTHTISLKPLFSELVDQFHSDSTTLAFYSPYPAPRISILHFLFILTFSTLSLSASDIAILAF